MKAMPEGDGPGEASKPALAGGVPLSDFTFDIAGRSWAIRAVRDQGALLTAAESFAEFPFGLLLWESAPALAAALGAEGAALNGASVLEIGAGVGFAGIVAASFGARVRQVDHSAAALDLCRANAAANGIAGVAVAYADWNDWRDDTRYDLIIGSDILYDRDAFKPLLAIFERNLRAHGRVLLADPLRGDTSMFLSVVRLAGWRVAITRVEVPAIVPANGRTVQPIDIIELRKDAQLAVES